MFAAVFVAELGGKTQLAIVLFPANRPGSRLTVFLAASAALVIGCAIGVLAGSVIGCYVNPRQLTLFAGGWLHCDRCWTVWTAVR